MDVLALRRTHLAVYAVVCGLAAAAGFGAGNGLMTGGILTGLAIALVSEEPHKASRVASLGVAGGLGMVLGEALFGGGLFDVLAAPPDLSQGPMRLAVRGAVCGGLGGGVLGMALSRARYRWWNLLWPVCAFFLLFLAGGYGTGIPRVPGAATGALAIALALFLLWLYTVKQDGPAVMVAGCGMVGFGVGLPLGCAVGAWAVGAGWAGDSWQLAKLVWGCCGGVAWGVAARVLDEDGCRPRPAAWQWPTYAGFVFIAWWSPVRNGLSAVSSHVVPAGPLPSGAPYVFLGAAVALLCVVAVVVSRMKFSLSPRAVTVQLFLWVMWNAIGWRMVTMGRSAQTAGVNELPFLLSAACGSAATVYAVFAMRRSRSAQT
jgi:hypothetical protein